MRKGTGRIQNGYDKVNRTGTEQIRNPNGADIERLPITNMEKAFSLTGLQVTTPSSSSLPAETCSSEQVPGTLTNGPLTDGNRAEQNR